MPMNNENTTPKKPLRPLKDIHSNLLRKRPSSDRVQITSEYLIESVTVYSATGKIVSKIEKTPSSETCLIDVSNLESGSYIASIQVNSHIIHKQLIIQ